MIQERASEVNILLPLPWHFPCWQKEVLTTCNIPELPQRVQKALRTKKNSKCIMTHKFECVPVCLPPSSVRICLKAHRFLQQLCFCWLLYGSYLSQSTIGKSLFLFYGGNLYPQLSSQWSLQDPVIYASIGLSPSSDSLPSGHASLKQSLDGGGGNSDSSPVSQYCFPQKPALWAPSGLVRDSIRSVQTNAVHYTV